VTRTVPGYAESHQGVWYHSGTTLVLNSPGLAMAVTDAVATSAGGKSGGRDSVAIGSAVRGGSRVFQLANETPDRQADRLVTLLGKAHEELVVVLGDPDVQLFGAHRQERTDTLEVSTFGVHREGACLPSQCPIPVLHREFSQLTLCATIPPMACTLLGSHGDGERCGRSLRHPVKWKGPARRRPPPFVVRILSSVF